MLLEHVNTKIFNVKYMDPVSPPPKRKVEKNASLRIASSKCKKDKYK